MSSIFCTCSMETGQISTHAPQLVQAQSDSSLISPPTIGSVLARSSALPPR